jgi:cytosine/adenosine deaminase-related metal-dependent hydrolase
MEELREIQMAYGIPVQSHLSESKGEIDFVKFLRPENSFYADSYNEFDLFGKNDDINTDVKTVMAHCVWSTDEEVELIRQNGVFVAHCPASNMNLTSGIAPIRKYLERGLYIGLGSDVAGGHSDSVFRAVTDAIQVSKMYYRMVDENCKPLVFSEAFYLATKGGGAFFGKVGSFEEGYEFDAVILEAPFTSVADVADKASFYLFPVRLLLNGNTYDSMARIHHLNTRLLIGHGVPDKVVPYVQGEKLFEKASKPKEFFSSAEAGHRELPAYGFISEIFQFLEEK